MRVRVTVFALSTALAAAGCSKKESEAPPVPVKVGNVAVEEVRQSFSFSGAIKPDVEVKLAFKQAGYVASLHQVRGAEGRIRNVQVGDLVAAGTTLARLRTGDYSASLTSAAGQGETSVGQLGSAQSDLAQAEADQKKADLAYERAEKLYPAKAMTRPDYDSAVADHRDAAAKVESSKQTIVARKGQVESARGQIKTAQIALSETNLTTTRPGIVESKDVEPGDLVAVGTTGFTIADARIAKFQFGVPDSLLPVFKVGAPVTVTVEGLSNGQFNGYVSQIAGSANTDSRVFDIQVSLPNKDQKLKVGMVASVSVEQAEHSRQLPIVPVAALITPQSGSSSYSVFVVTNGENGKQVAHLHSVRVGATVGRSVVIDEGLVPGDRIIVERTNQLADGSVVRIVD